jgi:ABC-type transport system involved in multi-copper enzyme maturation permease subunit
MSAATLTTDTLPTATREIRTTFAGLLRGELRKIVALRITWIVFGVVTLFILGAQLLLISGPTNSADLKRAPLDLFYNLLSGDVALVRIFSGIFMLILAAHVVGLEYQYGTIRVLLARGVGRLQLLGAKVAALTLVGFAVLLFESLIELAFGWGLTLALADGGQPWRALGDVFWVDLRVCLFYLALNLVVTMLLGVAASVVGRSLAFGLAVGLSWFAVDNLLTIPLALLARFTHSDFWLNVSSALLGPLLNRLPDFIAPPYHVTAPGGAILTKTVSGFGPLTLVPVPGGQALLVIGLYTVLFIAVAVTLTRRRDVLE